VSTAKELAMIEKGSMCATTVKSESVLFQLDQHNLMKQNFCRNVWQPKCLGNTNRETQTFTMARRKTQGNDSEIQCASHVNTRVDGV
jgi:hypothetical protein